MENHLNIGSYFFYLKMVIQWHFREFRDIKKWRRKIFKGNTKRTYRNVSVLREHLLGSREAFKDLGWSSNL